MILPWQCARVDCWMFPDQRKVTMVTSWEHTRRSPNVALASCREPVPTRAWQRQIQRRNGPRPSTPFAQVRFIDDHWLYIARSHIVCHCNLFIMCIIYTCILLLTRRTYTFYPPHLTHVSPLWLYSLFFI